MGSRTRSMIVILGALVLALGSAIGSAGAAYAQIGQAQYCFDTYYCLNAWNGGPDVDAYTPGVGNNDFWAFQNSDGYETIEYTGVGSYSQECVSDLGNSSTDARAGLNGYCAKGQIAWGANFQLKSCTQLNGLTGWAFKNVHWPGWLAPNNSNSGAPFYLNDPNETCFQVMGPA
jgi:hypothetical protein